MKMEKENKYCNKEGTEESPCECEIVEKENKSLSEKSLLGKHNFYRKKHVKEFIKDVEKIIIKRQSRRLQLIELGKAIGKDLI